MLRVARLRFGLVCHKSPPPIWPDRRSVEWLALFDFTARSEGTDGPVCPCSAGPVRRFSSPRCCCWAASGWHGRWSGSCCPNGESTTSSSRRPAGCSTGGSWRSGWRTACSTGRSWSSNTAPGRADRSPRLPITTFTGPTRTAAAPRKPFSTGFKPVPRRSASHTRVGTIRRILRWSFCRGDIGGGSGSC